MSGFRYPIKTAALLARASYRAKRHPSVRNLVTHSLDENDVQAHFLDNGILLIPGSNSPIDYLKFNLRVLNIGGTKYKLAHDATDKGHSGTVWHQGFLAHAKHIFDWVRAENLKPKFIIGHSLGAAATQILCKSYKVHGIAFAAPRPRKHRGQIAADKYCLCINRKEDAVCGLVPRFNHLGQVQLLSSRSGWGMRHHMKHYQKLVDEFQANGTLPESWGG
ncbi:hypothetical protein [Nereida sp. MMG025]|uniref:hypothetical protein n=1 Tax=Nereida sp. MMG025 TaxID=2909981 RepID=UPI001F3CC61A|nr:hypothetical protein [Nereida sp. MMG025]MCF6444153.1 hypothetical protein [Nereida sp. MMG025]